MANTVNQNATKQNSTNQNATKQNSTNQNATNQNATNLKSAMNALAKASSVLKRRSNKLRKANVSMQVAPSVAGGRRTHKKRALKKRTRRNKF